MSKLVSKLFRRFTWYDTLFYNNVSTSKFYTVFFCKLPKIVLRVHMIQFRTIFWFTQVLFITFKVNRLWKIACAVARGVLSTQSSIYDWLSS